MSEVPEKVPDMSVEICSHPGDFDMSLCYNPEDISTLIWCASLWSVKLIMKQIVLMAEGLQGYLGLHVLLCQTT